MCENYGAARGRYSGAIAGHSSCSEPWRSFFAAFVAAYFLLFLSKRCSFAAKFCFSAKVFPRVRIARARLHNYRNKIPFYVKFTHATLDYYVIFFRISKNFYNGLCKKTTG
ncbi:MAG TPA: hypothetical protein IAB69_01455 [Candidatus Coproplasma excrementigallinarum]|uniref:Uncharacterized protein n=1 Tax=Candidatus Coproplasma excrementigallinarum TaxID=2840747 RepID=A0A9D1MJL0_9FIRM|nr:hypothetical protein [Candidatus Coproplasma excrementigallinarum]